MTGTSLTSFSGHHPGNLLYDNNQSNGNNSYSTGILESNNFNSALDNNSSLTSLTCDSSFPSVSNNTVGDSNTNILKRSVSLSPTKSRSKMSAFESDDECNDLPEFPDNVNSMNMITPTSSHTNLTDLSHQSQQHQQQQAQQFHQQTFAPIGSKNGYRSVSTFSPLAMPWK